MEALSWVCKLGLALVSATSLVSLAGCHDDDIVDIPDELRGDPYCALIIGTFGHYPDGRRWLIVNYETGFVAGGCLCATEEEVRSGARDDEFNDAALVECKKQAATMDFAWDECEEDHASGNWLTLVFPADGEDVYPPTDMKCYGDG